jgi:hypothetical protein
MEQSGDAVSAEQSRKAVPYHWTSIGFGLAAITAAFVVPYDRNTGPDVGWYSAVALPITFQILTVKWGRTKHVDPAIKSFNTYLANDLGLPGENASVDKQ